MITRKDVLLALSYSGNTQEIVTLLPLLKRLEIPLVTMTGNPLSQLAKAATVNLDVGIRQEACPLGLAPTTSTTATLVMGDALAIALLQARGFSAEDFALSHPGGALGKRLLLRVDSLFHEGEHLPVVLETTTIRNALIEVTAKKLGMTCVTDQFGHLTGIYTDGDIRRTLMDTHCDIEATPVKTVMTKNCQTIQPGLLAVEALAIMQKYKITSLVVTDDNRPKAVVHLHDLLREGVF